MKGFASLSEESSNVANSQPRTWVVCINKRSITSQVNWNWKSKSSMKRQTILISQTPPLLSRTCPLVLEWNRASLLHQADRKHIHTRNIPVYLCSLKERVRRSSKEGHLRRRWKFSNNMRTQGSGLEEVRLIKTNRRRAKSPISSYFSKWSLRRSQNQPLSLLLDIFLLLFNFILSHIFSPPPL